jgi:hypothetical protein
MDDQVSIFRLDGKGGAQPLGRMQAAIATAVAVKDPQWQEFQGLV